MLATSLNNHGIMIVSSSEQKQGPHYVFRTEHLFSSQARMTYVGISPHHKCLIISLEDMLIFF